MAQRTASEAKAGEAEQRKRLVYWVNRRMREVGIKSVRELARRMDVPPSNVSRYFSTEKGTGLVPLIYLPALCEALQVDPAYFTILPEIPVDPVTPYALPQDDPFLVVLASARLARRAKAAAEATVLPVEDRPPARPRKRAEQGVR